MKKLCLTPVRGTVTADGKHYQDSSNATIIPIVERYAPRPTGVEELYWVAKESTGILWLKKKVAVPCAALIDSALRRAH